MSPKSARVDHRFNLGDYARVSSIIAIAVNVSSHYYRLLVMNKLDKTFTRVILTIYL